MTPARGRGHSAHRLVVAAGGAWALTLSVGCLNLTGPYPARFNER